MIITLISLALLIVGIVLFVVDDKFNIGYSVGDLVDVVKIMCTVLGAFATLLCVTFGLANVIAYDIDYQDMLSQKEMLEYRIEHMEENITGNEMLYNDIVEFNNALRFEKKWANNPWTSWFNNQDIASIDYVELDKD